MSNVGQILALDLASRAGWALGGLRDRPVAGSVRFKQPWSDLRSWLSTMLDDHPRIVLAVIETPLPPMFKRGQTTFATTRALIGMAAVATEYLASRHIEVREAEVKDVRVHFIGSNKKREDAKPLTIAQCRLLGWDVIDDNAADACALWDYQRSLLINENLRLRAGA